LEPKENPLVAGAVLVAVSVCVFEKLKSVFGAKLGESNLNEAEGDCTDAFEPPKDGIGEEVPDPNLAVPNPPGPPIVEVAGVAFAEVEDELIGAADAAKAPAARL
jgi:hypothetical protein